MSTKQVIKWTEAPRGEVARRQFLISPDPKTLPDIDLGEGRMLIGKEVAVQDDNYRRKMGWIE